MAKKTWVIVLVVLFLFSLGGCGGQTSNKASTAGSPAGSSAGNSEGTIKIGAIFPFTGSSAKAGQDTFNGTEIAKDMVNDAGGVNGKKVEFIKSDAPDATAAVSEANRLITQEGLKILIGSYFSANSLAIAQVAEKNKVFFGEMVSIDQKLMKNGYKYVFRINPDSVARTISTADYINNVLAKTLNKKPSDLRVAIIAEDGAYGQATADGTENKLKSYGIPVVAREQYSAKSLDLSALVLKLKDIKPDIIVGSQYSNDANLFWKQCKELGLNFPVFIANGGGYADKEFVASRGKDTESVLVSNPLSTTKMDSLPPDTQKVYQEFIDRYKSKFGVVPPTLAMTSFSSTWLFLHDILPKATNPNDPDEVRKAAIVTDLPEGSTPSAWGVKFDENGQNTRAFTVIMQWQNQKLVTIYPEKYAESKMSGVPLLPWDKR